MLINVVVDTQPQAASPILQLLLPTYAYYVDRASRKATQQCLFAILASPTGSKDLVVLEKFLQNESSKLNIAPASRYVLLEWSAVALQHVSKSTDLWTHHGTQLVSQLAVCFEKFLASKPRENRIHSALVTTRRALRTLFKSPKIGEQAISTSIDTLTSKSASPKAGNAPLLGVIAGVAARLPSAKTTVQGRVADFHGFYVRELLGSRIVLPSHIANGMHDFFANFESAELLQRDILPAIEKALLRAPEVVLNDLITPLIGSLPRDIDLSEALRKQLLKPILASTKSSNTTIREGSLSAHRAIIGRCHSEEALIAVSDELLRALKDTKVTDQRVILTSMLAATLPSTSSDKFTSGLGPVLPKETSEPALINEVNALGTQVEGRLSKNQAIDANTVKLYVDGLRNKKPSIRRIWALGVGNLLWPFFGTAQNEAALDLAQATLEALIPTWEETIANPIQSVQSGLAPASYVLLCFAMKQKFNKKTSNTIKSLEKVDITRQVEAIDTKQSVLINARVYTKISAPEDISWFLRVLATAAQQLPSVNEGSRLAWAQAMIFCIASTTFPPISRREALDCLRACVVQYSDDVPQIIIDGLWLWISNYLREERDSAALAAQTGLSRLWLIVRTLCVRRQASDDNAVVEISRQMVHLLVLCRLPLISRVDWISLCLRAGVDPHQVVSAHVDACVEQVKRHTNVSTGLV